MTQILDSIHNSCYVLDGLKREGGRFVQDFFRVSKILQVEFSATVDKNHRCKKIFQKFHLFKPPPGVWNLKIPFLWSKIKVVIDPLSDLAKQARERH